ncbi:glycoside hydrolase family 43 protein [Marinactinospora thermotolerans]|uniref:Beta-xylosidase n=1 Tax=Marinactinospora thermotolerans DSM 45154 TaxID=1122192 RepID=A0A1T4JYK0_9ACTN|nr:glycoside hydrolase 43 family protein [Marinactinospora thermotolerans]SJZ35243.1 Beta-xylosidase [Marinactinospora thermotolerans DSM 45154]
MRAAPATAASYRNPVLAADFSDPDVIRVGADYYLVASSFHRVPGLPVLHSRDLVDWSFLGHALARLEPEEHYALPRWGGGVWAPAIRYHAGLFRIFYPDPDHGLFVVTAPDPRGPWSRPIPLKEGAGYIDPCPLWDGEDAYLVHAWARSRSGVANRLTLHRMSPDGTRLLDRGRVVVDGDLIPGCHTLEGPKLYRRDGWYWILAPAGGVTDGWQSAFRSRSIDGPYEHRVVMARNGGPINGPHQGAWVSAPAGDDWFVHFQDRGPFGRVVHLQPMTWRADGWPVIGFDDGSGCGTPVEVHPRPLSPAPAAPLLTAHDDFRGGPGPRWTWQANPRAGWLVECDGLGLVCVPDVGGGDLTAVPHVLGQRLPAFPCTVTTRVRLESDALGAVAGLTVLGDTFGWVGLRRGPSGPEVVRGEGPGVAGGPAEVTRPLPGESEVGLRVDIDADARCRFLVDDGTGWSGLGPAFTASPGRWVGATLGLFALGPAGAERATGHAVFRFFRVEAASAAPYP